MSVNDKNLYAAHVAEMQSRWASALAAENLDRVIVHSGTPMYSFQDDYEYSFRPNPNFLAWLPLPHHHDSVLLVEPGQRPKLFYFQPDDYWYLPPADPASWWADQFDIHVVTDADNWQQAIDAEASGFAALGDSPALAGVFDSGQLNPASLTHRLHVERTRKTDYEIACMAEANRLAARAHRAAEEAFRQGLSEYQIHQRYLSACEHSDSELPYNNIVALNEHGAVLHYQSRERSVPTNARSFLIDAGCTCNGYASDITRTYAAESG